MTGKKVGTLQKILRYFLQDNENHIFYRIVDNDQNEWRYKIQCMRTRNILTLSLLDTISDRDIIYGLHPIQACFIGIELSLYLKLNPGNPSMKNVVQIRNYSISRYGRYRIYSENRDGTVSFIDKNTEVDPKNCTG